MKKIIVVGCNGQLGRAIMNELSVNDQYEVLGFNSQQLDIANQQQVTDIISKIFPYAVINCAAYTKVNDSEENINRAYMVNALGARNLAIASNNVCSKLVHISTDYVFDGKSNKPYTEFEKTNPLGIYAKSKLLGEKFIKTFSEKFFGFRTSGLYGNGKNFVNAILEQSRSKNEIQVVSDQTATPTSALELAKCISSTL